jgi:hypothetical protein
VRTAKAEAYYRGKATAHWAQFCRLKELDVQAYWDAKGEEAPAPRTRLAPRIEFAASASAANRIPPEREALF